jgi:hypothetical protein
VGKYRNSRTRRRKAERRLNDARTLASKEIPARTLAARELPLLRMRRERFLEDYKDDPAVMAETARQAAKLDYLTRLVMED